MSTITVKKEKEKRKRKISNSSSDESESESESENEHKNKQESELFFRSNDFESEEIDDVNEAHFEGGGSVIIFDGKFDKFKKKKPSDTQKEHFDKKDPEFLKDETKLNNVVKKELTSFEKELEVKSNKLVEFIEGVCATAKLKSESMITLDGPKGISRPGIIGIVQVNPAMKRNIQRAFMKIKLQAKEQFGDMPDYYPFIYTDDMTINSLFGDITSFMFVESEFIVQNKSLLQITGDLVDYKAHKAIEALSKECYWDNRYQELVIRNSSNVIFSSDYPRTKNGFKRPRV